MAKLMTGPFGIYSFNLRVKLNQIIFTCHGCNLQKRLSFTPQMAGKYVKVSAHSHPYERIRIDLFGAIHVVTLPNG